MVFPMPVSMTSLLSYPAVLTGWLLRGLGHR
ncbi:hypothetical protein Thiowin_01423 [Thiorhodovibrio winogradskyi]|uniref:Uncharacterized protein n=1 Tax=Thiorhodovibrio winogradskyi TaxID=77007 RepID=A0ABZ0S841_9GAMM